MNKYNQWLELKSEIRKLTEQLHEVESDIYIEARDNNNLNLNGSRTFNEMTDRGYFSVTIKHNETVSVDQEIAQSCPDLFKAKFEFDKRKYSSLNANAKSIVDEAIVIKQGKPTFKIEYKEMV
jgi:hypothetical protein